MNRKKFLALCGALLLTLAVTGVAGAAGRVAGAAGRVAGAAAAEPAVTIRIEGAKRTLLLPTVVKGRSGWITRGAASKGDCPGRSVQGALDVATRGHWTGQWYASYHEYFITSILGQRPKGSDYWTIFVNNRSSSLGACDIKLRAGQQLLFAVTDGSQAAASLTAPHSAVAHHAFRVKLVGYAKATRGLAGVRITGNGIKSVRTNGHGIARIVDSRPGVLVLRAAPRGYVRTEAIVHVAR